MPIARRAGVGVRPTSPIHDEPMDVIGVLPWGRDKMMLLNEEGMVCQRRHVK